MAFHAIAFLSGILLFQQSPELPSVHWLVLTAIATVVLVFWKSLRSPAWFCFGLFWAHAHALLLAPAEIDPAWWGKDLTAEGRVVELPRRDGDSARFLFRADRLSLGGEQQVGDWRVRLTWYRAPQLPASGERWRLRLRLKPTRSYSNPGSFDYEGWLYRRGVRYGGYVRDDATNARLAPAGWSLDGWREAISRRVAAAPVSAPAAGLLRALTVGDRAGLGPEQWEVFSRTGTNHLVAISGLHVGLVAGMIMWLVNRLWRRLPALCARWPASQAAAWAGLAAAFVYAALAGFAIPTQRALLMLLVVLGAVLLRRPLTTGQGLALALISVLLFDPTAVLAQGFWLSFMAVGVILLALGSSRDKGRGVRWVWLQLAIAIGLAPLLLLFYQQLPLSAPLVNLLAIPLFGFLIVPLALLGLTALPLSQGLADTLFRSAGWLCDQAMNGLDLAASLPFGLIQLPSPSPFVLMLALAGVALLLLPRGVPARSMGLLMCLPLLMPMDDGPQAGGFRFTLLDVGQGTAAVIETGEHVLVYDTGPGFRSGFNTGEAVVAPFLRGRGWRQVDLLVLSHGDKDHAGGAQGLLAQLPARRILGGEPDRLPAIAAQVCRRGQDWTWDGVRFEILHPQGDGELAGNDASCVLRVSNAAGSLLLTGDIEARSEALLLEQLAAEPVDILTMPHHGSRTSSSPAFIKASGAGEVLVSAGWRNRYGFPLPDVAGRWQQAGVQLWSTVESGAIRYEFRADGSRLGPHRYRVETRRYWHLP